MSLRLSRMAKSMKTHWVAGLAVGMQLGLTAVHADESERLVREARGLNPRGANRFVSSQEPVVGGEIPAATEVATSQNVRGLEPLRVKPLVSPNTSLSGIGTGITPQDAIAGRLPDPIPLPYGPDREGGSFLSSKAWVAPVYCHFPTYYEDVMLEQHGHERCCSLPRVAGPSATVLV